MKTCPKCKIDKELNQFHKRADKVTSYCKECRNKDNREYIKRNKKKISIYSKKYSLLNKEKIKEYNRKTINKRRIVSKLYYKNNREKILKNRRKHFKERSNIDSLFKLRNNLRKRIWDIFKIKRYRKNKISKKLLNNTFENVKIYIENKFTIGMTWENYGLWHIDHVIPLASAKNKNELIELCKYTNLQPLWAKDNYKKSDKIILKD